jgi:uncharacterized damage-inducible protein DinB
MGEIKRIISLLQKTVEKNAWHGPSLKEALADVTPEMALKKLPPAHSIIELISHMTSWRIFTLKKLRGDIEYSVSDELNFPATTDWQKVLQDLEESQHNLINAMESFPEEKLKELVPHATHRYTYYTLLHGIIHHDLYHLGQIMLLKKLFNGSPEK